MATMSFTLTTDSGMTITRDFVMEDGNVQRLINYATAAYPNEEGDDSEITPDIALRRWLIGTLNGTQANIVRHEKEMARKALEEPAPISIEPIME